MDQTICHCFVETSQKYAHRVAHVVRARKDWQESTWSDYFETTAKIALGLHELGVRAGDHVAIFSNTRVEWAICDMAILGLGAVTIPIYQSNTAEDVAYILNDSQSKVLICEDSELVEKFATVAERCPSVQTVICLEKLRKKNANQFEWGDLLQKAESGLTPYLSFYRDQCLTRKLSETASILYTSGTTGLPKGVILTHTQIMSEISDAFGAISVTEKDCSLSFLPYAHILGRIEMWGQIYVGFSMGFAQSIERIRDDMIYIKPTILIAVPRLFEKIYTAILAQVETSRFKKGLFKWAMDVGRTISLAEIHNRPASLFELLNFRAAKKLVFNNLHQKMGGRLRFAVSGGAPLSREIAEFFHAAGILILEGYGMTETTAAIAVNTPFDFKFGTVGKPIGDVKIKFAEDGEILVKSKKVMVEYYHNQEANSSALSDGWFHTGDIGEFTPEGYLRITDRKKELIKTAGGKYVAPQKLEGLLKVNPLISQVLIVGDKRKYVVALLTLNPISLQSHAQTSGIAMQDPNALVQQPKIREFIREAVAEANAHLASYETIKNFAILNRELTVEDGELTPSLKIKRKLVEQKYKETIDSLYI